ncbi:MAG: hypothetical protein HC796_07790 [Synechococcaceae cyanobacterium RL_1_2]|nr:hypothetical protein [Synechococcaceae cyanobacterium RL_1_2]
MGQLEIKHPTLRIRSRISLGYGLGEMLRHLYQDVWPDYGEVLYLAPTNMGLVYHSAIAQGLQKHFDHNVAFALTDVMEKLAQSSTSLTVGQDHYQFQYQANFNQGTILFTLEPGSLSPWLSNLYQSWGESSVVIPPMAITISDRDGLSQYGHARCCALLRGGDDDGLLLPNPPWPTLMDHGPSWNLVRAIALCCDRCESPTNKPNWHKAALQLTEALLQYDRSSPATEFPTQTPSIAS